MKKKTKKTKKLLQKYSDKWSGVSCGGVVVVVWLWWCGCVVL